MIIAHAMVRRERSLSPGEGPSSKRPRMEPSEMENVNEDDDEQSNEQSNGNYCILWVCISQI